MKKHRALWVILIVAAVLAAAAAGGWFWLQSQTGSAEQLHAQVYAQYKSMLDGIGSASLTVTENGAQIGSYDLQTLGLQQSMLDRATAQFTQEDRLTPADFAALPIKSRLEWGKKSHPSPAAVAPELDTMDLRAVLADLQRVHRTASADAYIELADGVYSVHPEVMGDELNEQTILQGLQDAVAGMTATGSGVPDASFELTSVDCYLRPAVTTDTLTDTPDSLFRKELAELEIKVTFNADDAGLLPTGEETLTSKELASLVDLDADGAIVIREDELAQTVSQWATKYNKYDAPFIFDSWVKGMTAVDFVRCNYLVDAQRVLEQVKAQILTMQSGEVDAQATCYDKEGKPFSLGQSYVEVDFDNQQMTFIKDGRLVVNTNVVTGALNGHQTPTGLYEAHGKEHDVWLQGDDYLVFVKYWVSVVGDLIGLHDASWRSNFGASFYVYGGSHGCVNTPEEAMAMIWNLVEDGTPVIMHGQNKWYEPANGNPYETKEPVRGTTSDVQVESGTRVLTPGSDRIEIQPEDVVPFELPAQTDEAADKASAATRPAT